MRQMLVKFAEEHPAIERHILETDVSPHAGSTEPKADEPDWCICTYCRDMGRAEDNICCRKSPMNCKNLIPDMDIVVLDPQVLRTAITAMAHRNDLLAEENLANNPAHTSTPRGVCSPCWRKQRNGLLDHIAISSCQVLSYG